MREKHVKPVNRVIVIFKIHIEVIQTHIPCCESA